MTAADRSRSSRQAGIARALATIESKFGIGAVQRFGETSHPSTDALPTGLPELDDAIGIGGWPRGRICEIFGPESVGVTSLLVQTLAAAQQRGGIVAFIDVDHVFLPNYVRRLGAAVEDIFIAQPDDGPMALEIMDALVRCGAFDVIVLDSVPGLYSPAADAAVEAAGSAALQRARLLSEAMRRLAANIDRTKTVVVFGNRQTEAAAHETEGNTPGGHALRFYSSVRLGLRRGHTFEDEAGSVGATVTCTVAKNKVAPPFRTCELRLVFGEGFTNTALLAEGYTAFPQGDRGDGR